MTTTYELPTFLGDTVPVELLAALDAVEVENGAVTLRCRTQRYYLRRQNYYGTLVETPTGDPVDGPPATLRLDFVTPEIVRLRSAPGPVADEPTPIVVGTFAAPVALDVTQDDGAVTVSTSALRVVVTREPLQLRVHGRDGRLVFATRPPDLEALRRPEEQWNPSEQRWNFFHRYAYPWGWTADRQRAFASFQLAHDEHIYGLGETYGELDKRGTEQRLWLQEAFSNTSPASYKQVPFYVSTRGYGLLVNSSNALKVNVGNLDHTALSLIVDDTDALDCYLVYGPTIAEILPRYTQLTGAPAVPPRWTFGLWMSRITYRTQEEVERVAHELREHRIPCDVIHIDTGWFLTEYVCDWRFGPQFPDPEGMVQRLRDLGFRVSLWQWPNVRVDSPAFAEGLAHGYFARRTSGHVYLQPGGYGEDAALVDYSNPEAVAWYQDKLRSLFALGIAAIKVDYGEGAPPDAVYAGVPSAAMHNRYPLLYGRAVWEVTEEARGEGQAVLWARSAWAGSQRYPVHWSGDGVARYEDLACVLRAALSFGLSGFPFYSHDIGGFTGLPTPELYVRWAQLGAFSSHARTHGMPPREPWAYGERAEDIVRRYLELRSRLMPYLWSEAVACGRTSLPMVRALVIDYQDDPVALTIDDQYMFGSALLVAPVLDEAERRRVYLPHGRWVDHRSGALLDGGRFLEVEAPLDTLPLFVKAGAVLPLGPVMQHTGERRLDPLTIELWAPGANGEYLVRQEDGDDIAIRYRRVGDEVTVEVDPTPGDVEVVVRGAGATGPLGLTGPGPHRANLRLE